MKKYIVYAREVHIQPYRVEAESKTDAIAGVLNGHGEFIEEKGEFSHLLDTME